ncbi:single-stranded DNA-binding protein [Streptomyces antibioticus]|uniref:single-stranded DNA-binding protein n=1 Tax=Streptomyces antibioticus TaxID=1890 RepID=UPI00367EE6E3
MPLPHIEGIGRLTADPELRFVASGKAVANISIAFNSRRKNERGEWEDGDTLFLRGSVWERLAENVAESLAKGMEVAVTGELYTESWEKDGQKHERAAVRIRSIAPSLAYAVAKVSKDAQSQQGAQNGSQTAPRAQTQRTRPTNPPQDDPWAVDNARSYSDEPPF